MMLKVNRNTIIIFVLSVLWVKSSEGKKVKDLKVLTEHRPQLCRQTAEVGDEISVHYTGYLEDGTVFDSSRSAERGPFTFTLGEGKVIPGWEKGIKGMCTGEKRKLTIPPDLAYGEKGYPPTIPPGATLIFSVELIDIPARPMGEQILGALGYLILPAILLSLFYYIYYRAQLEKMGRKQRKKKTLKDTEATLTFEVELIDIKGQPLEEQVLNILQFFSMPAVVVVIIYYVYKKYKEQPSKKETKEERRSLKKKRH